MIENEVEIMVDDGLSKLTGQPYLVAEMLVRGVIQERIAFDRKASPEEISRFFYKTGCAIKTDPWRGLPKQARQFIGDLYIEASRNVPGLENRTSGCLR
jgi:hypothetical protein